MGREEVRVLEGGCIGLCHFEGQTPEHGVMMVFPENVIYKFANEADLDEIINTHVIGKRYCKETDSSNR